MDGEYEEHDVLLFAWLQTVLSALCHVTAANSHAGLGKRLVLILSSPELQIDDDVAILCHACTQALQRDQYWSFFKLRGLVHCQHPAIHSPLSIDRGSANRNLERINRAGRVT